MAERASISRGTLYKLARSDPSVSIGVYATVLAILGFTDRFAHTADRRNDSLALDIDEARLPKKVQPSRRARAP